MLSGAWAAPRLRDLHPDFTFSIHPYPVLEDGCALVINIDTRISVNADSPHVEEAKQFVEYLTQQDVLLKFVNSQSSFSPLKDKQAVQDSALQPMESYLTNGRSVIGADDNLLYPIWNLTRESTQRLLKKKTVLLLLQTLAGSLHRYERKTAMKTITKRSFFILFSIASAIGIALASIAFVTNVKSLLWEKSVTDIIEVTQQGSHALDTYIEKDYDTLHLFVRELQKQMQQIRNPSRKSSTYSIKTEPPFTATIFPAVIPTPICRNRYRV